MWASSVIFKKLTKVCIRPICENSPNLVTLIGTLQTGRVIACQFHQRAFDSLVWLALLVRLATLNHRACHHAHFL
jgi:hypothetical protein